MCGSCTHVLFSATYVGSMPDHCARVTWVCALQDNDIVLCDGECGRAYHEQCLQPRIHASELPEDEGWLCHACDAKVCPTALDALLGALC